MSEVIIKILIGILPKFIIDFWDKIILEKLFYKTPNNLVREINLFLKFTFPTNTPRIEAKSCKFLSNTKKFFSEKNRALDSLLFDEIGSIKILCRLPWLLMEQSSREIRLDSEQSRSYFLRLKENAEKGKIKYLYNINSLSQVDFDNSIDIGKTLNCYPSLLSSVNFDVMIISTNVYRHRIIFAMRPMGTDEEEIGVIVELRDLFLTYTEYFDSLWNESYNTWNQPDDKLKEQIKNILR